MVSNPIGKWRIRVDFIDLNKACLEDAYLLQSIDRLVDGASEAKFISFMDAYSGYNQIRMHPLDKEKNRLYNRKC